jgi:L-lactate dehydrogenase complex protein LldE
MKSLVPLNTPRPQNPTVALFITCLTDQFYPRVGVAVTKILEYLGCLVKFPAGQTCCGQPFFNNGYPEEARRLARRMVELFSESDYVVTPSASCCAIVREHFPRLFAGEAPWEEQARRLAARTFEFVELLDKVLRVDFIAYKLPAPRSVTYHYTCHLRSIGGRDESVKLLGQIGNIDFRSMEKSEQCCGFGGTFAVKYPAISGAIVEEKTRNIAATGADTLVCNDAGCTMNISGMCHRRRVTAEVLHIAEVIAQAMALHIDGWSP